MSAEGSGTTRRVERRIEPRLPKGFQDFLPEAAAQRQHLISTVRAAYDAHGYVPLFTPAIEMWDSLTGARSLRRSFISMPRSTLCYR